MFVFQAQKQDVPVAAQKQDFSVAAVKEVLLKLFPYDAWTSVTRLRDVEPKFATVQNSLESLSLAGKKPTQADIEGALKAIISSQGMSRDNIKSIVSSQGGRLDELKYAAGMMFVYGGMKRGGAFQLKPEYATPSSPTGVDVDGVRADLFDLFGYDESKIPELQRNNRQLQPIEGPLKYIQMVYQEAPKGTDFVGPRKPTWKRVLGPKTQQPTAEFSPLPPINVDRSTVNGYFELSRFEGKIDIPSIVYKQLGPEACNIFKNAFDAALAQGNNIGEATSIFKKQIYDPSNPNKEGTFYSSIKDNPALLKSWEYQFNGKLIEFLTALAQGDPNKAFSFSRSDSILQNIRVVTERLDLSDPAARAKIINYAIITRGVDIRVPISISQKHATILYASYDYETKSIEIADVPPLKTQSHRILTALMVYWVGSDVFTKVIGEYQTQASYLRSAQDIKMSDQSTYQFGGELGKDFIIPLVEGFNKLIIRSSGDLGHVIQNTQIGSEKIEATGWRAGANLRASLEIVPDAGSLAPDKNKIMPYISYDYRYLSIPKASLHNLGLGVETDLNTLGGLRIGLEAGQRFSRDKSYDDRYINFTVGFDNIFEALGVKARQTSSSYKR